MTMTEVMLYLDSVRQLCEAGIITREEARKLVFEILKLQKFNQDDA